jgi:hypothetical protein
MEPFSVGWEERCGYRFEVLTEMLQSRSHAVLRYRDREVCFFPMGVVLFDPILITTQKSRRSERLDLREGAEGGIGLKASGTKCDMTQ